MKLNDKGFSLFKTLTFIIIVGVVGYFVAPSLTGGGKLSTFLAYEDNMEDAATKAVLDCIGNNSVYCNLPNKGQTKNITLKELMNNGLIDTIKTPSGGSCDADKSYVRVENRGNLNYKFKVCLYCDDYTSDNDICN